MILWCNKSVSILAGELNDTSKRTARKRTHQQESADVPLLPTGCLALLLSAGQLSLPATFSPVINRFAKKLLQIPPAHLPNIA